MGVPTSEVGYTPAMPRREDHEVHKDMWWPWTKKYLVTSRDHKTSPLCSVLHSPVTSTLLGPKIFLSTLCLNILSLCSSLNVRDQVSHPHKTGKIIVLYNLILIFLDSGDGGGTLVKVLCYKSEDRWFDPTWCHWNFSLT